jgi:hypothetical protein
MNFFGTGKVNVYSKLSWTEKKPRISYFYIQLSTTQWKIFWKCAKIQIFATKQRHICCTFKTKAMWKWYVGWIPIKLWFENLDSQAGRPWQKFEIWRKFKYFFTGNLARNFVFWSFSKIHNRFKPFTNCIPKFIFKPFKTDGEFWNKPIVHTAGAIVQSRWYRCEYRLLALLLATCENKLPYACLHI